jgi:hypothetical protein
MRFMQAERQENKQRGREGKQWHVGRQGDSKQAERQGGREEEAGSRNTGREGGKKTDREASCQ